MRNGEGYLIRPDGTKFKGKFKNNYIDGIGLNITKDGRELIGFFNEGKAMKGKVIMYFNEINVHKMNF